MGFSILVLRNPIGIVKIGGPMFIKHVKLNAGP